MKTLSGEMDKLDDELLKIARYIEESLEKTITSLIDRNEDMLNELRDVHLMIDLMCSSLEERAIDLIGLFSPMGFDLKILAMALKISFSLNEMGRLINDIVKAISDFLKSPTLSYMDEVEKMAESTLVMIRKSIRSYVDMDISLAEEVCRDDDFVDSIYMRLKSQILRSLKMGKESLNSHKLFSIIMSLERMADYATSIAEATYYIITGEVRRCFGDSLEMLSEKVKRGEGKV